MKSSYNENDVTILLKDISGLVEPLATEEREKLIQSGKHYSQMLPREYVPSDKYLDIYEKTLATSAPKNLRQELNTCFTCKSRYSNRYIAQALYAAQIRHQS